MSLRERERERERESEGVASSSSSVVVSKRRASESFKITVKQRQIK